MPKWLDLKAGPKLSGGYKIFFLITLFPLFLVGIISTMWFVMELLPRVYDWIQWAESNRQGRGGGSGGYETLAALPAILICAIWYKIVQGLQTAGQKDHTTTDASEGRHGRDDSSQ